MVKFESKDELLGFLKQARAAGVRQLDLRPDGFMAVMDPLPAAPPPEPSKKTAEELEREDLEADLGSADLPGRD